MAIEEEKFIANYFLQDIQKACAVDGRILEATTRAREICSEFDYYDDIEKFRKKFESIPNRLGIKTWFEAIKICKKIASLLRGRNIQYNFVHSGEYEEAEWNELCAKATIKFNDLGKNFPKLEVDIVSKRRYEPQYCSQNTTVHSKELPLKLEKFKIFQVTIDKILSSEETYDLKIEYERQSKIGTEVWWNRMEMDKANDRRYLKENIITPYFLYFDVGIWMKSLMNLEERKKFIFAKNYVFVLTQEIDLETRQNKKQPKDNWKYIAKVIRLRSILEAANKHICCDHASYRRIMEALFMVLDQMW
jgi:hypothetical protein